ncbi:trypsin-like peptidase domain-containing protein [Mobilitalea sibirica]|uniref:Trypsin-like peptidase domain-containing protein n=1 Tax=Mobilitalea sibirica TaxID=1462919 RepID=A0A8J7H4Z7_9FIRM|nr:trypsin-like peptidase domain-containing protein [Mobilitalea sibirica]MBH1939796.1 trypsin-like peptidase domain-containing protein [Mobilitalea sibirica]
MNELNHNKENEQNNQGFNNNPNTIGIHYSNHDQKLAGNSDNHRNTNYYTYGNNGNYISNQSSYPSYSEYSSHGLDEKKIKKKGAFVKIVKFTVAAILFGIITGAVFQGYNYFIKSKDEVVEEDNDVTVKESVRDESELLLEQEDDSEVIDIPIAQTNAIEDGIISDVSDIVDKVMPSIVAINSSATITGRDFFGRQFNQPVEGSGSGIIIGQSDSKVLIVTNNHVIEGADTVEIVFVDDSTANAKVKGAEPRSDLAVVEVDLDDLSKDTINTIKVAALGDSDEVKAGEMAIAIGNALGYGQSVTVGYISAINREINIDNIKMKLLQTDAAINPGNSGGALINTAGEVIGINSVKYASYEVEGMGYSIPISEAVPMINKLMNRELQEVAEQGYLGINKNAAQNVTEEFALRFNMPIGVYINEVIPNSPADNAGLKAGHIIVEADDIKIETVEDLLNILSYTRAGDELKLIVNEFINGSYEEKELTVILGERPEE